MLAITGGRIITMAGRIIENGTVVVQHGKICEIGANVQIPKDADIIDVTGKVIMPGMIDAHSHLGIVEEVYREEGNDGNEYTDPVTPHLRAIDGINPADLGFRDALAGGVTTVVTGPGSDNVIGGEMVAMKTAGTVIDDMIVRFPVGLKAALGENPKRCYGRDRKMPATRMASAAILREALVRGQEYIKKNTPNSGVGEVHIPERDLKMEALARVLKRQVPLRIHAHRADDIMTAVRIAREFQVNLVIEHGTEGHIVANQLANLGISVVIGPVITNRAKVEMQRVTLETARVLSAAGVRIAIMTDHPVVPIQYLALSAALTVKGGLSEDAALRAVTIDAARILGLENNLGSLEQGKDADFIVLDRHPLDILCRIEQVFINGVKVYSII
ncbi:MAG: amidohydrolase [Desulfotomaculaceae bacterium]|nr:amidohydrolase [Desulfotomaculaceae bacterium]